MTDERMPRVSIIINNYNYDRFLHDAIDGALQPSRAPVQVIVVDDGSTDGSRVIVESYGSRITPVFQANAGQGAAFNAGFAASSGEIVIFLDADDVIDAGAVDRIAEAFTDSDVIKAHWRLRIIDADGNTIDATFPPDVMPDGAYIDDVIACGPMYDSRTMPPTSGNAWRREFLERVMPMPGHEFDHGADVYLHALAPVYGRMRAIDEVLGAYRAHGANHYWKSSLSDAKVQEYIDRFLASCRALSQHLHDNGYDVDEERWLATNFNYLWLVRLRSARAMLARIIPQGESVVIVNAFEWDPAIGLPDRFAHEFTERNGEYHGPPSDGDEAIAILEHASAEYLAVWWTCFWWLDAYPELRRYLESSCTLVESSDALVVYALRARDGEA